MNYTPSSDNLLLGSGAVYCDLFTGGVLTGEFHLGNVTTFSLSTADDIKEKYQSMDQSRGLYKAVSTKRTITLKIVGDEFSADNVALNTLGVVDTLTQAAGTVTGETITTSAKLGRYYSLAHRNVSDVVVTVASATKTETTDYTVDSVSGRVYIVPTGTIAAGATVTVAYSYGTVSTTLIKGGTVGLMEAQIRFIGDPAAGPAYEVMVWKVQLTPDGELGLISDDFGNWSLTGKVLSMSAAHPGNPYYQMIALGA